MQGSIAALSLVVVLGLGAGAAVSATATAQAPEVGAMFPVRDFPLLEAEASGAVRLASLADFRGKKVLLVHFASW
ncbi:MAG TPA: hypothetical protein PKE00_11060 [Planctomycetota bacterium]|nr:hypothetical protein [Planctomycetota bacterium]